MDTKTTLPITEARKKIFQIVQRAQRPGIYYTLTEKGRPKAVILSAEEFESWMETFEVMKDFPNLRTDIRAAEREYESGDYVTLEDILAQENFVSAKPNRVKRKYDLSGCRTQKGAKRT